MRIEYKSETRGYVVYVGRDLLGDIVLFRRWYGLNNRRGGAKRQVFSDEDEAMKEVSRIERLRLRRGYRRLDA